MGEDRHIVLSDGSLMSHEELETRITEIEPGIIKMAELPLASQASLTALGDVIKKYVAHLERWALLIDLSDAERPSADYRSFAVRWTRRQNSLCVAYIQPHSVLLRVALRFIAARTGMDCTIHATEEQALAQARKTLAAAAARSASERPASERSASETAPKPVGERERSLNGFNGLYEEGPSSHP